MKSKGIECLVYDIPEAVWRNDIATMGDVEVACQDPDGNLYSVGTPQP